VTDVLELEQIVRSELRPTVEQICSQRIAASTAFVIDGVSTSAIAPARFNAVSRRLFSLPGNVSPAAFAEPPNSRFSSCRMIF
jgi:hypothetical protein